jgi:CheY-like chemotaxis protein
MAAVAVLRPEIVLLDVQLPDLDGLAVAEQLASAPDAPAVVLISSHDAAAYGAPPASTRRLHVSSSPRAAYPGRRLPI